MRPALGAAGPADAAGFREVTLTFEHETAAATRLAGFGGQVEVLSPASVRTRLVATARELLDRYPSSTVGADQITLLLAVITLSWRNFRMLLSLNR